MRRRMRQSLCVRSLRRDTTRGPGLLAALAGLAAACVWCSPVAHASQDAPGQRFPAFAPQSFDGRTFGDVVFDDAPRVAPMRLAALRAWSWRDGDTRRLVLERDVVVSIGGREFRAEKAVVWIEAFDPDRPNRRQVAFFFRNVSDPGGPGDISVRADRLLVTGVIEGGVELATDLLERTRPAQDTFLAAGEERLAQYLSELVTPEPLAVETRPPPPPFRHALRPEPVATPAIPPTDEAAAPAVPGAPRPSVVRPSPSAPDARMRTRVDPVAPPQDDRLPPATRSAPMVPRDGVINVHAPDRTLVTGEEDNALIVEGGVVVQQVDAARGRSLQLSARRAVVFLRPGPIADVLRLGPGDAKGVYLEGDVVATDGQYTLRGPRVYYDFETNRAIVLDAVFWTYDESRGMPLYVRAGAIRQEAQSQWTAKKVRVANTSFADPHLSLGAETITITREERTAAPERVQVDARGGSFRLGDVPVVPIPRYRGDLSNPPLRSVTVGSRSGRPLVRTTWDMLALAGEEPSDTLQADLLIDGYFSRGPAVGADVEWDNDDVEGGLFGYIIHDDGRDRLSSGARIDHDDEFRGMILFENRWRITDEWSLFLEGSYVSDETFVDAFFPSLAETRREFANSIYARRLDDRSVFSLEARGQFNDFTPNQHLLQSQGFNVERLPELRYSRVADSFMDGALTYTSESSLSRLALSFTRPRLAQLGYDTSARARAGFGLEPGDTLARQLRDEGYRESPVTRFDTRHEITVPLQFGALHVSPFAVGRATLYDDAFRSFAPDEDQHRLFGAAGVRLWTSFHRIDDGASSSLFDVNRLRHIVEPSFTLWHGATNRESDTLPTYDTSVEDLATGTAFRAGVTNTWQTMRGGPGRWRSVDWLTLRTDYVWSSSDAPRRSPIGRWFESRPELSNLGEFATADVIWQTTDAVALSSNVIYDFETDDISRVSAGVLLDHGHGIASYAEVIHLEPTDSTLVDFGARWDASRRYTFAANAVYDTDRDNFQTMSLDVERRFAQWSLDVSVSRDRIRDDTVFAVRVRPMGDSGLRSRGLVPGLRTASEERGGVRSAWPMD